MGADSNSVSSPSSSTGTLPSGWRAGWSLPFAFIQRYVVALVL